MALQQQDKVDELYEYTSITEPGTIRVIKLEPSLDIEADLHCSLECKRLDDFQDGIAGHYTALSYVWGDATDVRMIFVEGRRLEITASLHCALRHIRHTHHASYVWADGTCINQPDVIERNIQVSMMGSIYKTAHRTIIFLGPSCTSCSEVMESISSIASNARDFTPAPDHGDILSKHILSHPWFTRVWTLQELVLSKNTWVQKGTSRVPWETFSQHVYEYCTDPADKQRITDLVGIKGAYWNPLEMSSSPIKYLSGILRQRRGAGVSDPRDMIFGHLGLCPPIHESSIRSTISIDYSQTLNQIFEAVAQRIVLDAGDLSLLTEVETVQPENRREGLPSWVPDWTASMKNEPAQKAGQESGFEQIHGHVFDIDSVFATPHVLEARGRCLRSIRTVFPRPANLDIVNRDETPEAVLSWATQKESQPIVEAVCTVFQESCERRSVLMWDENIIGSRNTCNLFIIRSSSRDLTREFCQLITNLYKTFAGANASPPENSEILLRREIANFLYHTLVDVYCRTRLGATIVICEDGIIDRVNSGVREGDLLCRLEGSSRFPVLRPCGKGNNKDENNIALVPVKGGPERQTRMEKVRRGLGAGEGGRTGEEEGTREMQMSLDVRLVDVLPDGDLYRSRWLDFTFGQDFSTGHEAVFAIH